MITFKRIILRRSTEKFSCAPYVLSLFNCLFAAWYGLPFVTSNNKLLTVLATIGGGVEAIYVLIFVIFAPKKEKLKICGIMLVVVSIFTLVALISVLVVDGNARKLLCGFAFAVTLIMMFGSPLTVIRLVIKSKSVEYMPFFLSLAVFNSSTSWAIFGLLGKDLFIIVPNAIGTLLGIVQLILYAIYRDKKVEAKEDVFRGSSIETGLQPPQENHGSELEGTNL